MIEPNGVPAITPQPAVRPSIAVAKVAIDLERGQSIVELKLRTPGRIVAAGFWLKAPTVLGAASMRNVERQAMPLLFVECDPAGELEPRTLLFLPSNAPFSVRDGFAIRHRATAVGQAGAMHVYEIVAEPQGMIDKLFDEVKERV